MQQRPDNIMMPPLSISSRLAPPPQIPPNPQIIASKVTDLSNGQKFRAATLLTLTFAILSLPQMYKLTNNLYIFLLNKGTYLTEIGEPTILGIIVHSIVFMIIAIYILYK